MELENIRENIEDLSKLFKFNKKELKNSIYNFLDSKENILQIKFKEVEDLNETVEKLKSEIDNKNININELKKSLAEKIESIYKNEKSIETLTNELSEKKDYINSLVNYAKSRDAEILNIKEKLLREKSSVKELQTELEDKKQAIETLNKEIVEKTNSLKELEEKLTQANNDITTKHKALLSIEEKFSLVSSLLGSNPNFSEELSAFKDIVKNEFLPFANKEGTLANEAEVIIKLQELEKELAAIVAFPELYIKNIVAIGGGFSSGKSQFISSFFKTKDIILPIGIEPVTAIPTYVISNMKNSVKGYSFKGGMVDIDVGLYKKLSHEFVKSFSFNLKEIMPYMMLSTPLNQEYFKNICLIDTPGYNPAVTDGYTSEDIKTSSDFIENATSLIWLIGLDSNGTIPASDLEFLNNIDLENKKLYIVANKADLRSQDDLEDILEIIEESLDDYDISVEGISAYSSVLKEEYAYIKKSLFDFLKEENRESNTKENIKNRVSEICKYYIESIKQEIKRIEDFRKSIKKIEMELTKVSFGEENDKENESEEINGLTTTVMKRFWGINYKTSQENDTTNEENPVYEILEDLKLSLNTKEHKDNLKRIKVIRGKFLTAIDKIFISLKENNE